jgi:predicted MFS family arabinose efflux permease
VSGRDISRVIAAEGVSNFGSMLSRLAIPWVATLTLDATPAAMAGLVVANVLAGAFGALLLGPLIDRSRKRKAMRACDVLNALLLGVVALAAWQGWVSMVLLVAAAAAGGVLGIAFDLARSAWIAQLVADDALPRRNAQLSMVGSLSETVAFAAGGWLYQALGAVLALALDALSYLGSALLLRSVQEAPVAATAAAAGSSPWAAWWQEQREGWRVLLAHPALRALAWVEALRAFGASLAGTSYMVYVARDLALPTGIQGLVFALGGIGAIVGAALAPRLGRALAPGGAMAAGLALAALGAACIPLASGAGLAAVALLVVHQVVADGGDTIHDVHDRTLRQTAVDARWLARVDAGIRGVGQSATLAGAAVGGAVGSALSARSTLVLSATVLAAAAVLALATLARRAR